MRRLSFAVEVFGGLALSGALTESLGSLLGAGEDRCILAGVLQDHAADFCALAFLDGTNHRCGGGLERVLVIQGIQFLFPPGARGLDFFNGFAGGVECFFGVRAQGLFGFLALLRIGDFLKLVEPGINRELPGFFFGFGCGMSRLVEVWILRGGGI